MIGHAGGIEQGGVNPLLETRCGGRQAVAILVTVRPCSELGKDPPHLGPGPSSAPSGAAVSPVFLGGGERPLAVSSRTMRAPNWNEMNLNITTRHHDLEAPVKEYVETRMNKVLRISDRVESIHVVLDREHDAHQVEVIAKLRSGPQLTAKVDGEDLRGAIDACENKIEAQIRHWKDKAQDHRHS